MVTTAICYLERHRVSVSGTKVGETAEDVGSSSTTRPWSVPWEWLRRRPLVSPAERRPSLPPSPPARRLSRSDSAASFQLVCCDLLLLRT